MCKDGSCGCGITSISKGEKGDQGIQGIQGEQGDQGPAGTASTITISDVNGHTFPNVNELRFGDNNAVVTSLGAGVVKVNVMPTVTTWMNIQNLPYYGAGTSAFRPQYTIEGNKIAFRGLLYIPLSNSGTPVPLNNASSYLSVPSAVLDNTNMSIVSNANTNNGTPQGRFFTTNVTTLRNLPPNATPQLRDISFSNVPAFRRYTGLNVANYRSYVDLTIGSLNTVYQNGASFGIGCFMVFSPYNGEYDGSGTTPLGNDPLGLLISKATSGSSALDYISATDNSPLTIPAGGINDFSLDAHNINSLGGFVINLEGLSGYLN